MSDGARTHPCGRPGCQKAARVRCTYCSRSCATTMARAKQTPERRQALARQARATQRAEDRARLVARVKCFANTEEGRIWMAYQFGKSAAKVARYRERQREAA